MRVKSLLPFFSMLLSLISVVQAAEFTPPRMLRVSLLEGDVTYQRPDLERWVDLSVNTPVLEGDKIWVGRDGRAELEFEDGNFTRLASNTIIEITRLGSPQDSQGIEIRFSQGLATFALRSVSGDFTVQTPTFSAQVKEAARFRLDVDEDGSGRLVMFEGQALVSSQTTRLYLRSGETVRFLSQDSERYYLGTNYVKDDWDRWNEEREAYLARVKDDRLHYGDRGWTTADLYNYGTWYHDPAYGRIWRPSVGVGWAPFRNGRWVWYPATGWTWISYEPWGWIPYHYGRWAYVNRFGWSWVPGPRYVPWCPGAVNWVQGSYWVGWVPLAPYEPWYGFGFNAVNIFISKNFGHRSGVTYWHRDHFLNGTPVRDFRHPREPYADGRIIAGQPRITPTPASRMPVVGSSPTRTFTNEDLEARRNLRERMLSGIGTSSPPAAPVSDFERMRQQRTRLGAQGLSGFDSNHQNLDSGGRVIPGVPNSNSSGDPGLQNYEDWGNRSAVRSGQRQRVYRIDGPPVEARSAQSQRSSPSTWARPTSPVPAPPVNEPPSPPASPGSSYDSRQRVYDVYRNRSESWSRDRYAPRFAPREGSSGQFTPYTPPSPLAPVTNPQRPTPSYTGPSVRPVGPPPNYQGPISSRAGVSGSHSGLRSGGASTQEGRAAVRGRMGR